MVIIFRTFNVKCHYNHILYKIMVPLLNYLVFLIHLKYRKETVIFLNKNSNLNQKWFRVKEFSVLELKPTSNWNKLPGNKIEVKLLINVGWPMDQLLSGICPFFLKASNWQRVKTFLFLTFLLLKGTLFESVIGKIQLRCCRLGIVANEQRLKLS